MSPRTRNKEIPAYEDMLAAYHRSFVPELKAMIQGLPLCAGDRVLDVGCGDGFYSGLLASTVAPLGRVTAVDLSAAYLGLAKRALRAHPARRLIELKQGSIKRLPFAEDQFDFVWCAQSLFSLGDPLAALREMTRVARRGGIVAVLEDDTLHQLLLPWPVDLELALRAAEWKAFRAESHQPKGFYIARGLRSVFMKAGLRPQRKKVFAFQREAPLGQDDIQFLKAYIENLRQRSWPLLNRTRRRQFASFFNSRSPLYLLRQPHFAFTWLDHVVWGKKT